MPEEDKCIKTLLNEDYGGPKGEPFILIQRSWKGYHGYHHHLYIIPYVSNFFLNFQFHRQINKLIIE